MFCVPMSQNIKENLLQVYPVLWGMIFLLNYFVSIGSNPSVGWVLDTWIFQTMNTYLITIFTTLLHLLRYTL